MKPIIALLDNHKHAARSLSLLLSDNGCETVIGSDALDVLLGLRALDRLNAIVVEQWNNGCGLADALSLRQAVGWCVPILLLASRFDIPPNLEKSLPAFKVVPTPTESDVIVMALQDLIRAEETPSPREGVSVSVLGF
ncbi:hypothetical protein ACFSM5_04810 [Lacibacterium aquatile]|uniref:Response regulatory domain-containing protein n=1 Tax=Lacibacterium aquatile TaxID=1168082 RepID=A0ABW5DM30_9PROT